MSGGPGPGGGGPVLVTGATGFAGGHLVDHLLQAGARVVAWGRPSGRPLPPGAEGHATWSAVDVTDSAAVARALDTARPAAVYHCAGVASVQDATADPARALRVNAFGTHVLLTALVRARLAVPVLVTGSALVYRPSSGPLHEDSPLAPSGPYGVSKLAQEMIAGTVEDLPVIIVRPFNHAGPRQGDEYATSSFARQIAEAEAGLREPVLRVGNVDARRDITDVRDTVRAYQLLVARGRPRVPYNVCRGEAHRVGDLLQSLVGMARVSIRIETDAARLRPNEHQMVLGDPSRVRAETGWAPSIPLERTLADTLAYWRGVVRRG